MNYNQVFVKALENVLEEYRRERIRFYSEKDLQTHLFCECLGIMRSEGFSTPFKIYAERGVFDKRKKIDLVLSDDDVLIELKLEPDYSGVSKPVVFTTIREAGGRGYGSVEEDLQKIDEYASKGKQAHFVMLDEDGRHAQKIQGDWKEMTVRGRRRYWLHVYNQSEKTAHPGEKRDEYARNSIDSLCA